MKIREFRFCIGLLFFSLGIFAQEKPSEMLLTDPQLQYELTEAVNQMYNFQFAKADSQYLLLKKRFPKHPMAYFMLGYSQFWRIMPNEDLTTYDEPFYAYMDTVLDLAKEMYHRDDKNFEAIFFLTAAYAFKGRLLSDREKWTPAVFAGGNALKYLKIGREFNSLTPEFLIGEGLFNYFAEWIPQNYKAFKPVMWFFPKGDKKLGLKLLKDACNNAFYTRTESQHYFIKIMLFEEKGTDEALPVVKYLATTYPDNPVFERLYARILFTIGNYAECERLSLNILQKIEDKKPGYEEVSGRYASFFLGWIYRARNKELSKTYFLKSVDFSEKVNAVKMNYYLYSLSALAKMAEDEKDKPKALFYYEKIKKNAGRKHEMYKQAKKYVNEND